MRVFSPVLLVLAGFAAPAFAAPEIGAPEIGAERAIGPDRWLPRTPATLHAKAAPTEAEVGDIDSFGRNLRWLGVADMALELSPDCSGAAPDAACQVLEAAPLTTSFMFEDLGRIVLPARATNSLLCHWFSPVLTVAYRNPGVTPAVGELNYSPTLTVENPVLSTPGLIDPTTGLPFGGRLTTAMTASERLQMPLSPGMALTERSRDSALCIAGFLTFRSLTQLYGLSEAQARDFFRHPTTVRMNIQGTARYVDFAQMYFGLRVIGD
jgi:hypothetical protein